MHVYYKLEIQDATSTKKEYQLQIIQLQNATKWVLVLTYLSKIQKNCYYKMTIGYGPIAVCYKMATDPNLKTSNWLKTAGCTYHKSTHSVVEIPTGIHRHVYFYTQTLHTEGFTRRHFYTQALLQTEVFTHRSFYTQKLLHRRFYTQTLLHTEAFYTQTLSHTEAFTQTLLHTEAFTHRSFYTQKLLRTEVFTCRHFYTQTLLHTEAFTHRRFYTQTLYTQVRL